MKKGYDKKIYYKRTKVETVNDVVKRKIGDNIYSKKVSTQNRELEFIYHLMQGDWFRKILSFM